jgi:hypothetical protein
VIHTLAIGHFDLEALKSRRIAVLQPLDMRVVQRLIRKMGNITEDGTATLGGRTVEYKNGYIVCPWLMPFRIPATEELARQLQQELGCVLYDEGRREVVTPERFPDY